MSRPAISTEHLSDTLVLSEAHADSERPRGWWLYDKTIGINLAMGAPSREEALVEALGYYQEHLQNVETDYLALRAKVDAFVREARDDSDDESEGD